MGLGCLDVPERGCERLAAMCVMVRRGVLERELEEHELAILLAANYLLRRKCLFHACPIGFLKSPQSFQRHEKTVKNLEF